MLGSSKRLRFALALGLVVLGAFWAERKIRFGRDLIFYSSSITAFTLSNGVVVSTNRWYDEADLIGRGSEFYTTSTRESGSAACLAISDPKVQGVARVRDRGGQAGYLSVLSETAVILDSEAAVRPVLEPRAQPDSAYEAGGGTYSEIRVGAVYVSVID